MDLNIEIRKFIQDLTSFQLEFNTRFEMLKKEISTATDEKVKLTYLIKLNLDCDNLINKIKSLLINVEEFKSEPDFKSISKNSISLLEVNENLLKERLNEVINIKSGLETILKEIKLQRELGGTNV